MNLVNLEAYQFSRIPDDCFVMTTCHESQVLNDVFWFSKYSAMHPCFRLDNILLLHLTSAGREQELIEEYMDA